MDQQKSFDQRYGEIDVLINTHRWREAYTLAKALTSAFPDRAQAWFVRALCAELTGDVSDAGDARTAARECSDYTPQLEGDCDRDRLFGMIRRFQPPDDFLAQVAAIKELHAGDDNRLGCLCMLQARWYYLRGDYDNARFGHRMANEMMTDEVWLFNNLLPWLKAVVMSSRGVEMRSEIYSRLTIARPALRILWMARLVGYGGKPGCRLDDRLQRFYWREYLPRRNRRHA